jgi:hypothetical protein
MEKLLWPFELAWIEAIGFGRLEPNSFHDPARRGSVVNDRSHAQRCRGL